MNPKPTLVRFIAVERGAGGARVLTRDGYFEHCVGGARLMAVFENPADANRAVQKAANRRPGFFVDVLPMRGPRPVSIVASGVGAAIVGAIIMGCLIAV